MEARPPAEIQKHYPPRGPLQLSRFAAATPFLCVRCGVTKTAKLAATYDGTWQNILCNGCYGLLLSIHDIKAGHDPDPERIAKLEQVLQQLVPPEAAALAAAKLEARHRDMTLLAHESVRFLSSAEACAGALRGHTSLEWSPAVIGLCKALELEAVRRVIDPLVEAHPPEYFLADVEDKDLGRVAKYCARRTQTPPELGAISYFLSVARNSRERAQTSPTLMALQQLILKMPNGGWLTAGTGFGAIAGEVARKFRNPAAHTDTLSAASYTECAELLIGADGALWALVAATTHTDPLRDGSP